MDADALKQTLEALGDLIPLIPAQVKELVQKGEELEQHADALLDRFESTRASAEEISQEIAAKLGDLEGGAGELKTQVETVIQELQTAIGALSAVDDARQALIGGLVASGEAMGSLQKKIQEGNEAISGAGDEFADALDKVGAAITASEEALAGALGTADEQIQALREGLNQAKTEINEKAATLSQELEASSTKVADNVQLMLDATTLAQETLDKGLVALLEGLVQTEVQKMIDELTQSIQDEMKEFVDAAVGKVTDAIEDLTKKVTEANESSSGARQLLEPIFDEIEKAFDPMQDALESIRDAAGKVGMSF